MVRRVLGLRGQGLKGPILGSHEIVVFNGNGFEREDPTSWLRF